MQTNQTADRNHSSFTNAFSNALAAAMTKSCGSLWQLAITPDAEPTPDESEQVWVKLTLDGSLQGDCLLGLHRAEATMLTSKLLQQPVDEFGAEQTEAMLRLIDAAASECCPALEQKFGAFTIKASSASPSLPDGTNADQITIVNGDADRVSVSMYIDSALKEGLFLHAQDESAGEGKSMKAATGKMIPEPVNLDLVMDVELNVTLRFGKSQLTLREVMELTSGSVVELDRQVDEPVELLLNGLVVARGEAVVVDGNYGLRVTEVSQHVSTMVLG
jgi:flagellar motor switch protein FliN/FliY